MSWLRRIFGGNASDARESAEGPRRAHARDEGPVYGLGDIALEPAKATLLTLLRVRGARSALIAYEGGKEEGWITSFEYGPAALGDPERWPDDPLPEAQAVDIDRAIEGAGGPDDELFAAAEAVMCDKWGGFAGEFEVEGRLLVDVESGRIVRRDSISVEGDPAETEVERI